MRLSCLLLLGFLACAPEGPGRVRVVNTTRLALRAVVGGQPIATHLPGLDASPYFPVPAGEVTFGMESVSGPRVELVGSVETSADEHMTMLVSGSGAALHATGVAHRFAAPRDGAIRVRIIHAAEAPAITVQAQQLTRVVQVGDDTGVDGLALPANAASTLQVDGVGFTVPALPARSEVLVVVLQEGGGRSLLGVSASSVLGFLDEGGAP